MNFIIEIAPTIAVMVQISKNGSLEVCSILDNEIGLIQFLLEIMKENIFEIDGSYCRTFNRRDSKDVYLHRIICEYYSKFDTRLKSILADNEINHKNFCKIDNRIENLEIVSSLANKKHAKRQNYDVLFTSEQIIEIRNKNTNCGYEAYNKKCKRSLLLLQNNEFSEKLFKFLSIKFNYRSLVNEKKLKCMNISEITLCMKSLFFECIIANNYSKSITNICGMKDTLFRIYFTKLVCEFDRYRCGSVLKNNLCKLITYYERYAYAKDFFIHYGLLNFNYELCLKGLDENVLIEIYLNILYKGNSFHKNVLITSLATRAILRCRGKYSRVLVLFQVEVVKRLEHRKCTHVNQSTGYIVLPLNEELLKNTTYKIKQLQLDEFPKLDRIRLGQNYEDDRIKIVYKRKDVEQRAINDSKNIKRIKDILMSNSIRKHLKILMLYFF